MADRVAIFNEGKIVQIGAPADVYERPASRFVADFVGSSNVFSPEFASAHGGRAKWTSLRPEKIGVFAPGTLVPASNAHADGAITMLSYQGAVTRVGVAVGDLRITADVPAGTCRFKQGDSVRLIWSKSSMMTMEDARMTASRDGSAQTARLGWTFRSLLMRVRNF